MSSKTKKATASSILIVLMIGVVFYASMEDYQKERVSEFFGSFFASAEVIEK
ncbi:hypothetical protein [Aliikangiella coralliicola]|uniref:hypothetical protein n=1 Tax=Aliikangiella coralliicola TaxID=2592383 RepID=UPI00143CE275|nr:hypothetical protein [Aliikangiella coralliicola]